MQTLKNAYAAVHIVLLAIMLVAWVIILAILLVNPLRGDVPQAQSVTTVYQYLTVQEQRIGGKMYITSLRLDLAHYTDYTPNACDAIVPDDNGHTCYVDDIAGILARLDEDNLPGKVQR